ncbi:hypothetical protein FA10DRAFT_26965 [Acaromyces ingoldii]|uniref:Uncharacterized protein n=1 Tax=Acaromyces ingoldii TaxID=215250 RepID=A0A316Z0H2_9BASI|nr:hypothetical protein FA10DRAFT_26965 [Acaromyces ingoldii]PWN93595.1 hypothetical protein FA10DRAFT_26965 [Acaromyces ingoldii]
MSGPPKKPHNLPPLSKDAFAPSPDQGSTANNRPSLVRLVVSGSAGPKAVDALAQGWKKNGFGSGKNETQLSGIVYELARADKPEPALEAFGVSNEAPNNIPLTLVHPLTVASGQLLPQLPAKDTAPPHAYIAFALPTITSAASLEGDNEAKWLAFLREASERNLTLELALPDPRTTSGKGTDEEAEKIREALERVLGKAWDEEVERNKKEGEESGPNTKGLRIILDALAAPPLSTNSSQLLRSQDLQNWSDFISVSLKTQV